MKVPGFTDKLGVEVINQQARREDWWINKHNPALHCLDRAYLRYRHVLGDFYNYIVEELSSRVFPALFLEYSTPVEGKRVHLERNKHCKEGG